MPKTTDSFDLSAYATVAERLTLFYVANPDGRVDTELVKRENGETIFKAAVFRRGDDRFPAATGWAAEKEGDSEINTYACVENTETSAVGRALANLGFTGSSKRPSREEMEKANRAKARVSLSARDARPDQQAAANAVHDMIDLLRDAQLTGFSPKRAEIVRNHFLNCAPASLPDLRRMENRVRGWIRRHEL